MAPRSYILLDEYRRRMALRAVMDTPIGAEVVIDAPRRTKEQNAHYHGLLGQLADEMPWPPDSGELHDLEWWKRRTTLLWLSEKKKEVEIITPLYVRQGDDAGRPEFGILLPHTSHLKVPDFDELIKTTEVFGAENGIVWKEPNGPEPPPREEER